MKSPKKQHVLLMGQTPPPYHGQAVATQILFDSDWPGFEVERLRMEYSEEMLEVGRFQWKKIRHLWELIVHARAYLRKHPNSILFYPPASASWVPFLRDVAFLALVRPYAGATVFIYHASGLAKFASRNWLTRSLAKLAYRKAAVSLEVAQEAVPPHQVFDAKSWRWCPCAIEVPDRPRQRENQTGAIEVLFVASLQEGKGVLDVIRTAKLLCDRGLGEQFRFRIVGRWFSREFEEEARKLHEESGVGETVEMVGELIGDAKWDAYFSADVFFFPTHYASEASPIVLMEALGVGLPIVATEWAGIPAMLEGCRSATLFPVRAPDVYAEHFAGLLDNREKLHAASDVSYKYYSVHFQPQRFVERVTDAFNKAVSEEALEVADLRKSVNRELENLQPVATEIGTEKPLRISVYLADQNPGFDRSFGISRMTKMVMDSMNDSGRVTLETISSRTSQQGPENAGHIRILPWGTRLWWVRLLTDHLHPLFHRKTEAHCVYYYPKGYLPLLSFLCRPSVVTIHDTIVQHDQDHYPEWRKQSDYRYWSMMLKHTLRHADRVLTVSQSAKEQIETFMERHGIPPKPIMVTYEPCAYEFLPQPENPPKKNYVIHLASGEPHKRTAHLVRWWKEAEENGGDLPTLQLIGSPPDEVRDLLPSSKTIVQRPFLNEEALQSAYREAKALILPSEIEGFGLPALEAYYLGTPVCFVAGTSVDEVLSEVTDSGRFTLDDAGSLWSAVHEVMAMSPEEVREVGMKLRESYGVERVVERMTTVFESL